MSIDVNDVRREVRRVKNSRGDNEAAHSIEDRLAWDVIRTIANGEAEDPRLLAKAAMRSRRLEFDRWMA